MPFDAARGGHAPGHLREPFLDLIEATHSAAPVHREPPDPAVIRQLTGQLWNCTDTLPGGYCQDLGLPRGSSYAQAARRLRRTHAAALAS
jgi:hypothetical protein